MKKSLVLLLCLMLCFAIVGCGKSDDTADLLESMQEHKTEYVGDASKVNALVGMLPEVQAGYQQNTISIQSDTEPYGLSIWYVSKVDNDNSLHANSLMDTYADCLFQSIGNLGYVEFGTMTTVAGDEMTEVVYTVVKRVDRPVEASPTAT